METALYDEAKDDFLNGSIDLLNDTIDCVLVDLDDIGAAVGGATNASPIEITETSHGRSTGDRVLITGVQGNTAANGVWTITSTGASTYTLDGSTGNGAYTSGGLIITLTGDLNYDDISAGAIATPQELDSKTVVNGTFDAADEVFSGVTGDVLEAVVVFKDTGTPATSRLIAIIASGTGLPFTPNGGDVTVQWNANGIFSI
jgi:hypothetical protein